MSPAAKGYLIAITGITIWSTTGIFIDFLITNYGIPPLLLAFWRNLLVCMALAPALYLIRPALLRIDRSQLRFFIGYGLILSLFNSIWTLSVKSNGAAVSTVLGYSSAGFTAFFAWWLFHETLRLPKIVAVMLSLLGCVLVSNAYDLNMWHIDPLGIITGLLSGVMFAGYNIFAKEASKRTINPWTALLYSFAGGTVFLLVFNFFPALPGTAGSLSAIAPTLPLSGWLVLLFLAFIPTLLGFGLYNTSMNYLPASIVSLLATAEPILTTIEAYLLLNERMTAVQILGSFIIISAIFMTRLERVSDPVLATDV